MTEAEICAWEAGIFEGEGSAVIVKPNRSCVGSVRACISNCDRALVEHFKSRYGGAIDVGNRKLQNRRPVFRWQVATRQALKFFQSIQPFVQLARNKERVFLAIACQLSKRWGNKTLADQEDYWREQTWYWACMKELNKRGSSSTKNATNTVLTGL